MICVKSFLICSIIVLAVVSAAPTPGGLGGRHDHHVIHVPYNIHTIHHHHVKKIVVPVPIVKKVFVEPIIHAPIVAPFAPLAPLAVGHIGHIGDLGHGGYGGYGGHGGWW